MSDISVRRTIPVCRNETDLNLPGSTSFSEGFCLPKAHVSPPHGGVYVRSYEKKRLPLEGKLATRLTDEVLLARIRHLIRLVPRHLPLKGKAFATAKDGGIIVFPPPDYTI